MVETTQQTQTLDRVKNILRTDLKLGDDFSIPTDAPLFGGEIDLDSLDALLLVTSIEKEFCIKVPNEAVGREVFQSVQTLSQYIDDQMANAQAPSEEAAPELDGALILSRLPHGEGFRFVSTIDHLQPGHSATGRWIMTGEEDFFAGHFPGNPVVPGVLITEALAQLSGMVGASSNPEAPRAGSLVHIDVSFRKQVVPPVELTLTARHGRTVGMLQHFEVEALVNDESVADGALALALPHNGSIKS